jgi:hypothetical protein
VPAPGPLYDLAEVQRQARTCPTIVLINDANATETVSATLGLEEVRARAFILALLCRLTPGNYAGPFDAMRPPADVYGLFSDGWGWYLKISLRHGRLNVHSCHPPAVPLRTQTETVTTRL